MTNKQKQVLASAHNVLTQSEGDMDIFSMASAIEEQTGIDRGYIFRTLYDAGIVRKSLPAA